MIADTMIKIDGIDRALVDGLVADGRASYTSLARLVDMSQAAVKTRVNRLLERGLIRICGRVDPRALGFGEFAYCLLTVDGPVVPLATRMAELDEAAFVLIASGPYQVFVELHARDRIHLAEAIEHVRADPQVRAVDVSILLDLVKQDWSQIGGDSVRAGLHLDPVRRTVDEIDLRLLEELAIDGRTTFTDMANHVGLSHASARERVLSLMESGIVTVQTIVSPGVRGVKGYVGLYIATSGPVAPIARSIASIPDVALVATILGRYDVIVEAGYGDDDHLIRIIDEIRAIDDVSEIDSFTYLATIKESMAIGLR